MILAAALLVAASRCHAAPPITALAFSRDGGSLVTGSQDGINVLAWPDLRSQRRLTTELAHVHDLAFSPAGDQLLACGGSPAEAGGVERFSWPDGKLLERRHFDGDLAYSIGWRPDGLAWAAASGDRAVYLAAIDGSRAAVRKLLGHSKAVLAVAWLGEDGKLLLSAGRDDTIRLWDVGAGDTQRALNNHTAAVIGLAVRTGAASPGPPMAASIGSDQTVRLWQPTIGRLVRFARLPAQPLAVAWTRDAKRVLVSSADGHIRAIDPETAEIVWNVPAIEGWAYSLAVSPRKDEMAVGGEGGRIVRLEIPPSAE